MTQQQTSLFRAIQKINLSGENIFMLMDHTTGQPFKPTPLYFTGPFEVYDRNELEDFLNEFDPNKKEDRIFLAKYAIDKLSYIKSQFSYRHVWMLVHVLEEALKDDGYDYSEIFADDDDECTYMPGNWNIENPKLFLEEILKVAKEEWKEYLEKASKEDPSTW